MSHEKDRTAAVPSRSGPDEVSGCNFVPTLYGARICCGWGQPRSGLFAAAPPHVYSALAFFVCWLAICAALPVLAGPTAFRPEKLDAMDGAINQAIAEKRIPGGVLWFEH